MNGHDRLEADRRAAYARAERERALAQSAHHLNQILGHLRAVIHYNVGHDLKLDLPYERQIVDAITQCARIHQLDKEKQP